MKGFTLIELLVVVLIIGILAAIALPQYQKAVEKSRVAEAIQNIAVAKKNIELFLLNNGGFPQGEERVSEEELESMGAGSLTKTDYFDYTTSCYGPTCRIEIWRTNSSYYYTLLANLGQPRDGIESSANEWGLACFTQRGDKGREICKSLQSQGFVYRDDEL